MKCTLEYPSELPTAPDDFLQPEVIRAVATQAEAAGFSAVALSEHPERLRNRAGRDPSAVDIQGGVPTYRSRRRGLAAPRARGSCELAGHGATWAVVHVDGSDSQASLDYIKAFGEAMGLVTERDISASRL